MIFDKQSLIKTGYRRNRTMFIVGFLAISVIFLYLRAKTLNHLLMWDEARNIISLKAFLTGNIADAFYSNYFFHPPFYMFFASMLYPFKAGLATRLELLSLLFSYASLFIVYILSAKIGGRRYAFLSALLLSIMPASIAYDTWIKRDGLASCLGYLAIFFLLKRKYLWCAAALSFSLLSKESALFFILAATVLLFTLKREGVLKKIVIIYGVIFIMASWWYILFSSMPGSVYDIYLSAANNISSWGNSPLYYFKKLLPDMGAPALILFMIGLCNIFYLIFWKEERRWSVPLAVVVCVYAIGSFVIACKTPWLCLSAAPALAMIAGSGALLLLRNAKKSKGLLAVLTLLIIFSIFSGRSFSYEKYHIDSYPNGWKNANNSRKLALYLNKNTRADEKVMMTQFSYWGQPLCSMCPVFLYYSDARSVCVADGRNNIDEIIKGILDNNILWLVINDSPDDRLNFHSLVKSAANSVLGKPASIGCSYVWNADSLW